VFDVHLKVLNGSPGVGCQQSIVGMTYKKGNF